MAIFAKGIPRLTVLAAAIAGLCLIPAEALSHGPNLCLWCHLFHIAACPACGSTRALSAFFHGQFSQALAFNRNVMVAAPSLIILLALDLLRVAKPIAKAGFSAAFDLSSGRNRRPKH